MNSLTGANSRQRWQSWKPLSVVRFGEMACTQISLKPSCFSLKKIRWIPPQSRCAFTPCFIEDFPHFYFRWRMTCKVLIYSRLIHFKSNSFAWTLENDLGTSSWFRVLGLLNKISAFLQFSLLMGHPHAATADVDRTHDTSNAALHWESSCRTHLGLRGQCWSPVLTSLRQNLVQLTLNTNHNLHVHICVTFMLFKIIWTPVPRVFEIFNSLQCECFMG